VTFSKLWVDLQKRMETVSQLHWAVAGWTVQEMTD